MRNKKIIKSLLSVFAVLVVGGITMMGTVNAAGVQLYNSGNITVIHNSGNITYMLNSGFTEEQEFTGVGTITVTDGIHTITMLDRNLGAVTSDISNNGSYGDYFEWGNNFGFGNRGGWTGASSDWQRNCTGFGPYNWLNNGWFLIGHKDHCQVSNDNLWGGSGDNVIGSYSVENPEERQGPCPDNFHIPSAGEWHALMDILAGTSVNGKITNNDVGGLQINNILLLPYAGYKGGSNSSNHYQGERAYYWTSSPDDNYGQASIIFGRDNSFLQLYNENSRSLGCSLRCFYNQNESYPEPCPEGQHLVGSKCTDTQYYDGNITYQCGDTIFTGVGTITITDGKNTITMLDRNLCATNTGTTCSGANNSGACGYYFQWGNNYGFPIAGANTDSTVIQKLFEDDYNGVYGWKYSLGVFITNTSWTSDTTGLNKLWGNNQGTLSGRQGPCPIGFHVPTSGELSIISSMMGSGGMAKNKLWAPFTNFLQSIDAQHSSSTQLGWRSSSLNGSQAYILRSTGTTQSVNIINGAIGYGRPIRCVYDKYEVYSEPTVTYYQCTGIDYTLGNYGDGTQNLFTGVGTITASNGTNTITILDRNLGAVDKMWYSVSDVMPYEFDQLIGKNFGYYFRWGNNTGYSLYSSNGEDAANLLTGDQWINGEQGPCPEGFHIPSSGEWQELLYIMGNGGSEFNDMLLLPYAGNIKRGNSFDRGGLDAFYWTRTPFDTGAYSFDSLYNIDDVTYRGVMKLVTVDRGYARPIRCFADDEDVLDTYDCEEYEYNCTGGLHRDPFSGVCTGDTIQVSCDTVVRGAFFLCGSKIGCSNDGYSNVIYYTTQNDEGVDEMRSIIDYGSEEECLDDWGDDYYYTCLSAGKPVNSHWITGSMAFTWNGTYQKYYGNIADCGGEWECDLGYELSNDNLTCVPEVPDCPQNQHWNTLQSQCVANQKTGDCALGMPEGHWISKEVTFTRSGAIQQYEFEHCEAYSTYSCE